MATFPDSIVDLVWDRATPVDGFNPSIWRKDFADAWICRQQYGKDSFFGWEIDHLRPVSKGGTDALDNLYPLHWRNNNFKSDNYPNFQTAITSSDKTNIEEIKSWRAR